MNSLQIFSAALLAGAAVSTAERPNIVFFIADDMRPEMFNCLPQGKGKNLTPNLDRLAREGTRLTGQHVVSPVCTPSRYNCLTGRYASRATNPAFINSTERNEGQTVVGFNTHIMPDDVTLPRLLQQAGYKTGLAGKNHVIQAWGMESFPNYEGSAKDPENAAILERNYQTVRQKILNCGFDAAESVYHNNPSYIGLFEVAVQNMDWITQGGLNIIDRFKDDPFFLYFATTVPHGPANEARSWGADPLITARGYLDEAPNVQPPRSTIAERLNAAGLPVNNQTANMLWLDDALGALIDRLETHGVLNHTVIFFFSDHGQNAKGTLYQGGVYDPSIVWKAGGFPCGSQTDALLSNVDFAPTILDLAGVAFDENAFDGKSFAPILNGEAPPQERVLYHELGYTRAIRKGDWKYLAVRYPDRYENMPLAERKAALEKWNAERRMRHQLVVTEDPTAPFSHLTPVPGGGGAEFASTGKRPGYYDRDQLYNLAADPGEQVNLAGKPEYAAKLAEMKDLLEKHVQRLPGTFGEFGKRPLN